MQIADRLTPIKPSPTLAADAKAKAMMAQGIDVINFGVGEPDFRTPDYICRAAIEAINNGAHKYTPGDGTAQLKKAISDKYMNEYGLEYAAPEIVISCGGKHALYELAQATLNPGDEVIIPAPYWVSYPDIALLAGAKPVLPQTTAEEQFKLSPDKLKSVLTDKSKVLILTSPSNPTGVCYSPEELKALAECAIEAGLTIWADEIYEKLVFEGQKSICLAAMDPKFKDNVVTLNGASKAYAMTGWRIGWLCAPQPVARAVAKIQSQNTGGPCAVAQAAATAALTGPEEPAEIARMVAAFDRRRKLTLSLLEEMNVITPTPTGAFYVFTDFSAYLGGKIKNSQELSEYLLEEAKVAAVAGSAFGAEGFIRFSYAVADEQIKDGLARIKAAVEKL